MSIFLININNDVNIKLPRARGYWIRKRLQKMKDANKSQGLYLPIMTYPLQLTP